jgi:tetratricopeptide (TPR) repeat protein
MSLHIAKTHPLPVKKILFPVLLLVSLLLSLGFGQLRATGNDTGQAIEQGVELYRSNDYPRAIALWEQALGQNPADTAEKTLLLSNLAKAYQQLGNYPRSIDYWEKAIADYRRDGDIEQIGRTLTEQAGDYLQLGQTRRAIELLCGPDPCQPDSALAIARGQNDETAAIAATATLAEAYRILGETEKAIDLLLPLASEDSPYRAEIFNSLGVYYIARGEYWQTKAESARKSGKFRAKEFEERAQEDFQKASDRFQDSLNIREQMAPLLQLIKLAPRDDYLQRALPLWESLPNTPAKVYAAIDLAGLPNSSLSVCPAAFSIEREQRESLLTQAVQIAYQSGNSRARSFAEGAFGHLYECAQQPEKALTWTRKALMSAEQNAGDRDSLYLWEWQSGRIWQERGETARAIEAYQSAFDTLERIRGEQVSSGREIRLNFRDRVEPLYRTLAKTRLDHLESRPKSERQREINLSLQTIDALRLAELQDYLGNNCLLPLQQEKTVDELVNKNTAIFSSMIFEDETVMILTLADGTRKVQVIPVARNSMIQTVAEFRDSLI